MQARIARVGEIVVVHLNGRVDVETAEPFRRACNEFLLKEKVVFDFKDLGFVGSSGILPFLETMQAFAQKNANRFKFSGVGSEFKKVFAATSLNTVEIYDTHQQAVHAFVSPPVYAPPPVVSSAAGAPMAPGLSLVVPSNHAQAQAQAQAQGQAQGSGPAVVPSAVAGNGAVQAAPQVGQMPQTPAHVVATSPTDVRKDFGLLAFRPDDEA
jgi:anti-anti-sigma factor